MTIKPKMTLKTLTPSLTEAIHLFSRTKSLQSITRAPTVHRRSTTVMSL